MDVSFMAFSRLAFGHWEGQPLYALADLGIAQRLTEPRTCAELAREIGCESEPLERLLDCAVAQKLLACDGKRYANTDLSARFLTEDSPESLLCWLRVMARWKQPWTQLAEAVRRGEAVDNQSKWLGEDPQFMRDFILGMHQFASRSGPAFAQALQDVPIRHLVDVGGAQARIPLRCARRGPT
ncbi:methyltransferase dimerization domain-containing protein [Achromobacter xylosoxidans]